ncbi:carbohydrate sulfotransferase 11 [Anopheles darlingi]|uniref:carbohydrate sulfotransferase 11 n=1 Tax=Anopheles darlingi TaxID=43151 RepID=UPI002100251B|nr:carbohydrate sulfotransferase 11 [Anopheles darlingi]XP_049545741.1 carbohydrate sulfotransferase 11 [Anopheles darlingi]XP_049545742.1 carbohydrate sulfotransferase 11 [Anopheles darlingi]
MKGHSRTKWRIIKRLFLFFTTLSVIPLTVLYLITSDQLYRFRQYTYGAISGGPSNGSSRQQLQQFRPPFHPADGGMHHLRVVQHQPHQLHVLHDKQLHDPRAGRNGSIANSQYRIDMDYMKLRMEHRVARLQKKCKEHRLDEPKQNYKPKAWEYLIQPDYHLVWCNVFKAASTSWMYNFNLMAGYSAQFLNKTKDVPVQLARQKYPRPSVEKLRQAINGSISFIIVRHPFERLVSAYKDKIQYALRNSHHHKLGIRIIQKYRKMVNGKPVTLLKYPTFSEFVDYLLDEIKHPHDVVDMHFIRVTSFCTPCFFHYDVIAKFETLEEDQNYLISIARLDNFIKPQWKNAGKGGAGGVGGGTKEVVHKLFSELNSDQIHRLLDYYRFDFELFGYSAKEYFKE